jgi:hypothetical protein
VLPSQATSYAALAVDTANNELWVTVSGTTSGTYVFARTASNSTAPVRQAAVSGRSMYLDVAGGEVGLLTGSAFTVISRTTLATLRSATTPSITGNVGGIGFGP